MTREEELVRIAKKLDKMVSRNNTVRLYFDTHRWRVVLRTRPLRASVRDCCSVEFPPKIPLDFCRKSFVILRFWPRCAERSTGASAYAGRGTCPSVRCVHLLTHSVAGRVVVACVSERKYCGLCGRSRRPVAAKTCVSTTWNLQLWGFLLANKAVKQHAVNVRGELRTP